jgi:hypothetical protein
MVFVMPIEQPPQARGLAPVQSPFASAQAAMPPTRPSRTKWIVRILTALVLLTWGAVAGAYLVRYLHNPYRTLPSFPVAKYLDGYRPLAGLRYKSELKVEADLGWKENIGKLMLFTTTDDSRPIAVFIPAVVAKDVYFTKGQTYLGELEIKEGGLIHANSIQKN